MKKLFLLLPALVLSLIVHATILDIGPTSPKSSDNVRREIRDHITSGDTLRLADGIYSESDVIAFDKSLTVIAAEGASPIIAQRYYSTISAGAKVKFVGIKFDGSLYNSGAGANDHCFYSSDASEGNELRFENCEFVSFPSRFICVSSTKNLDSCVMINCKLSSAKSVIYNESPNLKGFMMEGCEVFGISERAIYASSSASHMNSCIVNNCYFHDNSNTVIHFEKSSIEGRETCDEIYVTNSTFSNTIGAVSSVILVYNYDYAKVSAIKVVVDHCTFYNNEPANTDHGDIRVYKSTDVTISNCIFSHPTEIAHKATSCYGGTITNCLVHNLKFSSSGHRTDDITPTNNIVADPLFNDLANNNYTYPGNWITMDLSPARGAATDGTDLGDPRWYTDEVIPSTDFASPYDLLSTKALLSGNIALNANDHIAYDESSVPGTATWKMNVQNACALSGVIDMETGSSSGCSLKLIAYNEAGNKVDSLVAPYSDNDADIIIPGTMYLPVSGNYTFKLFNGTGWSTAKIDKITLSHAGGDVTNISSSVNTSLDVADAWFSGCTRGADRIIYPSSGTSNAWIKWNIAATETKFYDLTLNINAPNAHGFTASIYEDESAAPIASVTEGSYISTTGLLALELGRVNLVGGTNYVVIVTNAPSGSVAEVLDLTFAPVAASATELPGTLAFSNAVLSARAHVTDGNLYFAPIGDTNPVGEWARWAVTTDHDGFFLFTMGVNSSNGQSYKISIYNDSETLIDVYNFNPGSGPQTLKHYFRLAEGNYSVQVENTTNWSHGYLTSLVVTEPSMVTLDESAADNASWADKVGDTDYDVQIIRTLRAGMYNTFCLPFSVNSSQCKEVFGNDVEIYTLDEAIVDGFVMTVDLKSASDIYAGTPIFIKPSRDIVDPVFVDVRFARATPSATTKTHANLTGTFVRTTLLAGSDVLFLASDNLLYYPAADIECLGMRAWFALHDAPAPAPAITRARIINSQNVVTELELIGTTLPACFGTKADKRIDDGQLLIILNGKEYNALGVRIR